MVKIQFDLTNILAGLPLYDLEFESIGQSIVENVTNAIFGKIESLATKELRQLRATYRKGLGSPEIGALKGSITLIGTLPNWIEQGHAAFDMKQYFKNSPKAKTDKKGNWYLTIPFRHGAPDSLGDNEGFSGIMPQAIYDVAKGLTASVTKTGQATTWGTSIKAAALPGDYGVSGERPAFSSIQKPIYGKLFPAYQHQAPIYQGMYKFNNGGASQNTYGTFRRVGANTNANAFIHPGFTARNFFNKAANDSEMVDATVQATVQAEIQKLGI